VRGRLVVVLLTVLAAVLGVGLPASAADGDAAYRADRVVVVGVPGLVWGDVGPATTPQLWDLAGQSAIGALSVRAARSTTCLLDGWATLGAGNRARYPGTGEPAPPVPLPTVPLPDDPTAAASSPGASGTAAAGDDGTVEPQPLSDCGLQEQVVATGLADPSATVTRIAADEATARFGAEPGALGAAVGCAGVVGRAAAVAVAGRDVQYATADALPTDPAAVGQLLAGCPLSMVSLDALTGAEQPGETGARAAALGAVDAAVGRLRAATAALPGRTLLLVAGVSEVDGGRPQLHVAISSGPGFTGAGWLTSASTGRTPYVQLIDLAPTALRALGLAERASMNGQPVQAGGGRGGLADSVARLDRADVAAGAHYRSTGTFFWVLVGVNAALVVLGLAVLGTRRGGGPRWASAGSRAALRLLALAAAALPVATYLAGLVPWERAGAPLAAMAGAVLVADLAVLAVTVLGPWRARPLGPPLALLGITLATLVADVVTGSTLELDGLMGYDPIVAGRFTGYGNLTFGLSAPSALLLTTAAATAVGRRVRPERARRAVAGTVLGAGVLFVALVGAPALGRDFGGVLAAVPAFLLLAMLLTRTRVTLGRLVAILAAAVVVVGTVAFLDWLRPAAERSHLGRFVQQLLTGEAWTVVSRKAAANVHILLGSPLAWMLPVAAVAAWWLVRRRGGLLRGGLLRDGAAGTPGGLLGPDVVALRAGLVAVALSQLLGAAVNDSGVAVPAAAAALLVPLLVRLAAGPGGEAERTAGSEPGEQPGRVTVVSRGSTVWNA
jgi:hypothetical protein